MNTKKLILTSLVAAASAAASAAVYSVYEVHTVDELTNACAKATDNFNTIKVYPGVYDLKGKPMTPASRNTDGSVKGSGVYLTISTYSGKFIGMGATPGETVIKGAGVTDSCKLLKFGKVCTVSNLTFTGGCVSQNNESGGVCSGKNATFTDCVFSNNYAKNFGGVFDGVETVRRCRFYKNSAGASGGVLRPITDAIRSPSPTVFYDCHLERNTAGTGGVSYYGCSWSNCTFVGNSGTSGAGCFGGTLGFATHVIDCHFTNNTAISDWNTSLQGELIPNLKSATNCVFYGNAGGSMRGCSFSHCDFVSNTGELYVAQSSLRNCRVIGHAGVHANTNPDYFADDCDNCLFLGCVGGNHNMSPVIGSSNLRNCTVVSNVCRAANYSVVNGGTAVNTILAGNVLASGTACTFVKYQDINASNMPASLTNCLWSAQTGTPGDGKVVGGGKVALEALCFADAANGDYTITKRSVARNAGWSDAAYLATVGPTDLAGKPRVHGTDGKAVQIDVGAYEYSVPGPGLRILVR